MEIEAKTGFRRMPAIGYKIPAAIGIKIKL